MTRWWQALQTYYRVSQALRKATSGEAEMLQFSKALPKDNAEGSTTPYRSDVLAQLANIPARVTLYALLRLSKSTREALREALTDAEIFMAQIPTGSQEEEEEDCLHASQNAPGITFTSDDMQVKEKHDRPLYFTGYIGSSEVSRIQVDSGFACLLYTSPSPRDS